MINNAGITHCSAFADTDTEVFRKVMGGRRTFVEHASPFDIALPAAGSYSLLYALDLDNDGILVGSPFVRHDGPVTAPATGVFLEFNDTARIPGIAGSVTYTGSRGVSRSRPIIIQAFDDPGLTSEVQSTRVETNGGRYGLLEFFESRLVYLSVYLDGNYNRQFDPREPHGACSSRVQIGPDQRRVSMRVPRLHAWARRLTDRLPS